MLWHKLWRRWIGRIFRQSRRQHLQQRRTHARLIFEPLEDRTVPTTLTVSAGDIATLISDISQANTNSTASNPYVIDLTNSTYSFTSINNTTGGANVLPVISAVNLTIVGNGSTLNANSHGRLFDVAGGGSLSLETMTLTGGLAEGGGTAAEGGAIYNSGGLTLSGVTVKSNVARGSSGFNGFTFGGGLYVSGGAVTLNYDTFSHNDVVGGNGLSGSGSSDGGAGGLACGGGVYVAAGAVTLSQDTLEDNTARGGIGGHGAPVVTGFNGGGGGAALGGALGVAGGSVTLSNDALSGNEAIGGSGGDGSKSGTQTGTRGGGGDGAGGGLYVSAGVSVLQNNNNNIISGNSAMAGAGSPDGVASFANLAANSSGLGNFGFPTTTVFTTSANPCFFSQSVTFTAAVAASDPGRGTPTGSVTFYDGTMSLGSVTLNDSGGAALTATTLPVGSDSITAVYSGDSNFVPGESDALSQTVNVDATTTALSVSDYYDRLLCTATVTAKAPGTGTPTGAVTFYDGSTLLGSGAIDPSGAAIFYTSALALDAHHITAEYPGDGNFVGSNSSTTSLTVDPEFISSPTNAFAIWADVTYADANPGSRVITLSPSNSFVLNDVTGPLPQITSGVTLTIAGGTAAISRNSSASAFRLFDVAAGASLTLEKLTLAGGLVEGAGTAAEGGAIYNSGAMALSSVMINSNAALGSRGATGTGSALATNGANASGGGVYVAGGAVTLDHVTFKGNQAQGGSGGDGGHSVARSGNGGSGSGGAVDVAGGVVTLSNDVFQDNQALGGSGGHGYYSTLGGSAGEGSGGAVAVTGGAVTVDNSTLTGNEAKGGAGGNGGPGGGLAQQKGPSGFSGAPAQGGAVDVAGGLVSLINDSLSGNEALGGIGGVGGMGRGQHFEDGGPGSDGGGGGDASGGGLYVGAGAVALSNGTTLENNQAVGGQGGGGGEGGEGGTTDYALVPGTGGNGGAGGAACGGGVFVASGNVVLSDASVAISGNTVTAGAGGALGPGGYGSPYVNGSPGFAGSTSFADIAANSTGLGIYSVDVVTSTVTALPANETPAFVVNWSGSDAAGLGLKYSIFVSKNGETDQPWLTDTTASSAVFTGTVGAKYSFYSVATNSFGLVQPTPTSAEAATMIVQNPASSLSKSNVQVASTVTAGETTTVTLHVAEANGNPATSGGLTVKFALGNAAGGQGTFTAVTDNGNGAYSAVFTGTRAGSNTIVATINGAKVTSKAPTIAVAVGSLDLSRSPITTSAKTVVAGGKITITFQPEDAEGNKLKLPSLSVNFGLGAGAAQGTFSSATYNAATSAYTATFTTSLMGGNTITAKVGGVGVTSPAPAVTITPAATSLQKSVATLTSNTVQSGDAVTITLKVVNANGQDATSGGLAVVFSLRSSTGAKGTFGAAIDNGNGDYSATFTGTLAGANTIIASIEGVKVTSKAPLVTVADGPLDLATSPVTLSAPTIKAGGAATITFQPKDAAGNLLALGATPMPVFSLASGSGTFENYSYKGTTGAFTAQFTTAAAGSYEIATTYGNQSVTSNLPKLSVTPGPVSYTVSTINVSENNVQVGTPVTITFLAEDAYGNAENANLAVAFAIENGSGKGKFGPVTDLGNGEYQATFTGITAGADLIEALAGGDKVKSTADLNVTKV